MARQTSLDKFLAALEGSGLYVGSAPSDRRTWYGHDAGENVYFVFNADLVAAEAEEYVNNPNAWRTSERIIGFEVFFTGDGKYVGTNGVALHGWADMVTDDEGHRHKDKANTEWRFVRNSGSRRAEYFLRAFGETLDALAAISPVKLAAEAAEAKARAEARQAEQAAKVARIQAIKPDARNAIWALNSEMSRAKSDYLGSLKSIARYAEEMLGRMDEHGWVDESNARHLASIVADLNKAAATVKALTVVTNSELHPLFEDDVDGLY